MTPFRARLIAAAAAFLIAFAVYLRTLAPTVGLIDSGELTTAAWSLGNAHAPGFPLYLLVTHALMQLPLGSIAVRANLASAFFAALGRFREGVYVNFLGGDEHPDRVREAYGKLVYDRLVDVKVKYDPDNVFHYNQNIRRGAL